MSEFITLQVGQCGNQIGSEFWPLVLKEYGLADPKKSHWDEKMDSFFYTTGAGSTELNDDRRAFKARALLIDMEESVVSRFEKGPLRNLFAEDAIFKSSGGSGNNWAVGYYEHGNQYFTILDDMIRISVEKCDCLHGFLLMFSLSGGTGSGLGSRLLSLLSEYYSKTERFVMCVHPGSQFDVVNAPYNIAFTLRELSESASCVFPVDNEALSSISQSHRVPIYDRSASVKLDTYNSMNKIICKLLLELTSGARFPGSLNLDMSDLSTNMVPFPSLNFVSSSISPIIFGTSRRPATVPKMSDAVNGILSKQNELLRISAIKGTILSACLHGRGNISVTNMKQFCYRVKKQCKRAEWLSCIRYGLCSTPPIDSSYSLLCLVNSTAMANLFLETYYNFEKLYKKKAFVHHYMHVDNFSEDEFDLTRESMMNIIQKYISKDSSMEFNVKNT